MAVFLYVLFAAVRWSLMALNGQTLSAVECLLLDNSGQRWILGRDGLSANYPLRTYRGSLIDVITYGHWVTTRP